MVLYPAFIEHFRRLLSREQVSELQNVFSLLHTRSQIREGALLSQKFILIKADEKLLDLIPAVHERWCRFNCQRKGERWRAGSKRR